MKQAFRVWTKTAAVLFISATNMFAGWSLVWSDEFDQPDGTSPDANKWVFDLGGGGWGNDEMETYTSRTNNVRIEGGQLVIEARRETFTGTDGIQRDYTSGRLKTKGKASWTTGRMEARIKIPRGQGIWPAFWMLGDSVDSVGWPTCGEIDIMENIGREPGTVHGTIHGPGYSGGGGIGGPYTLTSGATFADDFHIFAIEWETNRIRWFVDDQLYFTVTPSSLPVGTSWVFTAPQFILLDLAVGGIWPGYPDGTTVMPQQMIVDYVRVYAPNAILDVDPTQNWIGFMNVFDLNGKYQWGSPWSVNDLRSSFDVTTGALTLAPNTNVYNPADAYWVNPDGSGAKTMDASLYVENPDLSGKQINFAGQCWANTLAAGYSCKAFIKDFSPDYSSFTSTNVSLATGQPFNLTMATTLGDHVQYGFETIGRDANPATAAMLGTVVVANSTPPSPVMVTQPASVTTNVGATATFSASASGATAYQWYKGTNALADGTNIIGTKSGSLTLSNVLASSSGDYQVVLSYFSSSTTSSVATLTVLPTTTDTDAPSLNLITPKKNSETSLGVIPLSGTSVDNFYVNSVQVSLNGGGYVNANITNGLKGAVTWGMPLTLNAGTNTLAIKVSDTSGNIRSTNIQLFYKVPSAFTVLTTNSGAGKVTVSPALPAYVGRTYFVTATPSSKNILSNIINVASSGTTLVANPAPLKSLKRIAIKAEPTNTIIVSFLTNRFVSAAGSYYGIFAEPEVKPTSSGLLIVRSAAQMTYSARMYLDGDVVKNIKGSFDIDGHSSVSVARPNGKSTVVLDLQLGFGGKLTGSVSSVSDGWSATIDADQAVFSSKAPAANFVGKYTMLIPGFSSATDGPIGYGYSLINILPSGVITAAGYTADNQSLSPISVPVSSTGRWPFFARQYLTSTGYNGCVIGWVHFTNNLATATFTGDLHWFKKSWTNGYYNSGFSNSVTSIGSAFVPPAALNFTTASATFSGGDLGGAIVDQLIVTNGVIKTKNLLPISKSYSYSVGRGTLTVSRTTNAPPVMKPIRGCYLQNQNYIGGYFLGTTQGGSLSIQ